MPGHYGFDPRDIFKTPYTPKMQVTPGSMPISYPGQGAPLPPLGGGFPRPAAPGGASPQMSGLDMLGGPWGIGLGVLGGIGSALNASSQRKHEKEMQGQQLGETSNQFAARYGLDRNRQDMDRQLTWLQARRDEDQLQRYLANQGATNPMRLALLAKLGGMAGMDPSLAQGMAGASAPPPRLGGDMGGLAAAVQARLGDFTPMRQTKKGAWAGGSTFG